MKVPCPACEESGVIECPDCEGDGVTGFMDFADCDLCKGDKETQCPECKGAGESEMPECPRCLGKSVDPSPVGGPRPCELCEGRSWVDPLTASGYDSDERSTAQTVPGTAGNREEVIE